jgi:aminoglycoside 6'-N-acetyltransferase I
MAAELMIAPLNLADAGTVAQAAELLVLGFSDNWPHAWPDAESARAEVHAFGEPDRFCLGAFDKDGRIAGWIGGIEQYDGRVYELHPLVVRPDRQRQGIGEALVRGFERHVVERGGESVILGSDDENDMTSLSGIDLYPEPLKHLQRIRNYKQHPYEFYTRLGYHIVGVVPDANGWGKPDILMAKRLG